MSTPICISRTTEGHEQEGKEKGTTHYYPKTDNRTIMELGMPSILQRFFIKPKDPKDQLRLRNGAQDKNQNKEKQNKITPPKTRENPARRNT